MKNSQKGFIVPVLLVVISLLVVGGGVYVYYSKRSEVPAVVDTEKQQSNQIQQQTTQTPPATNKATSSITVVSPSAGERVSAGSSFLIKWDSTNVSNRVLLTLHLSGIQQVIAPDSGADITVPNSGSFTWKVPKSFDELNSTPVDLDYVAYITINDAQNKNIIGQSKNFTIVPANGLKTYSDTSILFEYSSLLSVGQSDGAVILNHSIAYKHSYACDFKGDAPLLDRFTDFGVSIKIVNQNLKTYLQSSSYPSWDYVSKNIFKFGSWDGYRVTQGLEGCGSDVYYFPVSKNKSLIISRSLIPEFTTAPDTNVQRLPGIITPYQNEKIFAEILSSLKVK
ncbi:MAG: hypothetical protein A3G52_04995 [Candidatus Taylorbacteria bacterium RIFCSPLOWO2_12_FULL_43_20]|uniref:Yeast cell wall synthesis Kre9/Knh1-like N-terminal domain-containing protein n=1 Tax=Candidatus Taylorbacteria bacterium RIFCSPLOWO2_12_FULL_43_20 TaxID=1802332 RepID=A0A1G2NZ54_9BACT|nr:MAG: hypothetical protein A2825_03460 [Candidatus Taylorbacteria bacterium RIFCSPHIGHO2_01_FULL_43_120]OHA23771.1 MAG: hypothetical protein A3B98_02990 [Candidatus Taylorbacteria bacterium RIFCSPHIGHO2_02_FULL_43_55]OHA30226.1 MAG: hypothetical protein A3E92_01385 [Candidatus Taylorbacteria bacterium RIFCSPHIGHO2_12_FULL_42_34]OHA31975.1 MAG: hypothetical protein A3B09_01145 [Candidatus Taylorbacteria bacterium RIFCSPLOWO2_01_FULL_43_83]OHA37998.1 MAG: hypothetical protein A3H58_01560 [Candi